MAERLRPEVGKSYRSAAGQRLFSVEELHPGDPFGREVRGRVEWPQHGETGREHSCSLIGFPIFWRAEA